MRAARAPRTRLSGLVRQSFAAMTPTERRRVSLMYGSILGLHVLGFAIFIAFVVPAHYKGLGIGDQRPGLHARPAARL